MLEEERALNEAAETTKIHSSKLTSYKQGLVASILSSARPLNGEVLPQKA